MLYLKHNKMSIIIKEANISQAKYIEEFSKGSPKGYWEYEYQNFMHDKSVFILAMIENKIVGTEGLIPYNLNINGEILLTARSERTLLATILRGGNTFTTMMNLCVTKALEKGHNLIWGFTLNKRAFMNQGFNYINKYNEHSLFCLQALKNTILFTKKLDKNILLRSIMYIYSSLISFICRGTCFFIFRSRKVTVTKELRQINDIDKLYSEIKRKSKNNFIYLQQDEDFREWFLKKANKKYLSYYAYDKSQLSGYLYCDVSDPTHALIKDIAALGFFSFHKIIGELLADLKKNKTIFVRAAYNVKNDQLKIIASYLYRTGFIPVIRRGGFVIRPLSYKNLNVLYDIRSWYITPMWADLYSEKEP